MDSSADGDREPTSEEPADAPSDADNTAEASAIDDDAPAEPAVEDDDEELAELREAVEEKYDFDNFGPAEMAQMSGEEWEAAFDPETWITGERLLDRVEADLKSKIAAREIFAVVEREADQLVVYSDTGYAVVSADGTVDGEGGVRRDVEPVVAMCSMEEYEVGEPPADYELPSAETVPEQTGEFGNLMIQLIAGGQLVGGVALVGAFLLRLVETIIAPVVGGLFMLVGIGLFALVANARLSDRFRAEQYRNRLRAVEAGGIDRPEIDEPAGVTTEDDAPSEPVEDRETEAQ
ncbi:phage holin family protein [Halonotius sp. F2-221B]|uniref:phage holin family protein n=1 Tax=Halonotius sp. F2-221B TaxID=2731620 RepID=UPI00398B60A6